MQFAALNRHSSDGTSLLTPSGLRGRPTREAQESACLACYHSAIKLQHKGELAEAKRLYCELLESELLEEAEESQADGASVGLSTVLRVKYLIFKNLASIAKEQGDLSTAIDAYIKASSVDTSDVTLWCQLSSAAAGLGNLLLSKTALQQALEQNDQYWPAIESLCTVLLALRDHPACLRAVARGLELKPHFPRGLVYLRHIFDERPELAFCFPALRIHLMKPHPKEHSEYIREASQLRERRVNLSSVTSLESPLVPPKKLTYLSIYSLGKCLVSIYHHCKGLSSTSPTMCRKIDVSALAEGVDDGPNLASLSPSKKTAPGITGLKSSLLSDGTSESSGEEGPSGLAKKRKTLDSDLAAFVPKRRSTRVRSKKEHPFQNHAELLSHFLPPWLGLSNIPDVAEFSPLRKASETAPESARNARQLQITAVVSGTQKLSDRETVKDFLKGHHNNSGIINLLYEFLLFLSTNFNSKWPLPIYPIVKVFLEAYELLHPHLRYPSPLCGHDTDEVDYMRQLAMIALCYVELYVDAAEKKAPLTTKRPGESAAASCVSSPPVCFSECLAFLRLLSSARLFGDDSCTFALRVCWCLVRWRLLEGDKGATILALKRCQSLASAAEGEREREGEREGEGEGEGEAMEEEGAVGTSWQPLVVYLCNCSSDQLISLDHINDKLKSLEQSLSFEQVHHLHRQGDHSSIVDTLLPVLDMESGTYTEFLVGSERSQHDSSSLSLLLDSLVALKQIKDCVSCCVRALLELLQHYKMGSELWVAALRTVFATLQRCFDEHLEEVLEETEPRLLRRLATAALRTMDLVSDMADSALLPCMPTALPWRLLYLVITSEWRLAPVLPATGYSSVVMETGELKLSLQFLKEAHDQLGSMGWCCRDEGCLLLTSVVTLRKELQSLTALPPKHRTLLLLELAQCYSCLYGHPSKKAKSHGLQDHNAEQISLTWDAACKLMEYYHPSFLPSIDDSKSPQVTTELIALYKRVIEVIPEVGRALTLQVLNDFVDGSIDVLPEPHPAHQQSSLISDVYYLLADDCLKGYDNHNAIRYYLLNLCYCPEKFDSWAGLALARYRLIMARLNKHEAMSGTGKYMLKQTAPTVRCFKKAVTLNSKHCYIVEKFGFFCYSVQALASRVLSQPTLFPSELLTWARVCKREMLLQARTSFSQALRLEGMRHAEPWIYCYMLGKLCWKLGQPAAETLGHLLRSAEILCRDGASYPEHVELATKGHALEAVEVHYQLHSCALKYLLRGGKPERESNAEVIREILAKARELPLAKVSYPSLTAWVASATSRGLRPGPSPPPSPAPATALQPLPPTSAALQPLPPASTALQPLPPASTALQPLPPASTALQPLPLTSTAPQPLPPTSNSSQTLTPTSTALQSLPPVSTTPQPLLPVSMTPQPFPSASTTLQILLSTSTSTHTLPPASDTATQLLPPISLSSQPLPPTCPLSSPPPLVSPASVQTSLSQLTSTSPQHRLWLTSTRQSLLDTVPPPADTLIRTHHSPSASASPGSSTAQPHPPGASAALDSSSSGSLSSMHLSISDEQFGADPLSSNSSAPGEESVPMMVGGASLQPGDPCPAEPRPDVAVLRQCLYGIAVCFVRCSSFFKPPYRLAMAFSAMGYNKIARQVLLGPLPQPLAQLQEKLQPLFVLKANIFTNMWQIPVDEFNRPGSFSTHARRSLELLVRVLVEAQDLRSLLFLAQQLRSKPDASKRYMRDGERAEMVKKITSQCVTVLQAIAKGPGKASKSQLMRLLQDAYATRMLTSKIDSAGALTKLADGILLQCYGDYTTSHSRDEDTESLNSQFEVALKFCQSKAVI